MSVNCPICHGTGRGRPRRYGEILHCPGCAGSGEVSVIGKDLQIAGLRVATNYFPGAKLRAIRWEQGTGKVSPPSGLRDTRCGYPGWLPRVSQPEPRPATAAEIKDSLRRAARAYYGRPRYAEPTARGLGAILQAGRIETAGRLEGAVWRRSYCEVIGHDYAHRHDLRLMVCRRCGQKKEL